MARSKHIWGRDGRTRYKPGRAPNYLIAPYSILGRPSVGQDDPWLRFQIYVRELRMPLKPIYGRPKHDAQVARIRAHKDEVKQLRRRIK